MSTVILEEVVETIGNKGDTAIYTLNLNVSFITKALIGHLVNSRTDKMDSEWSFSVKSCDLSPIILESIQGAGAIRGQSFILMMNNPNPQDIIQRIGSTNKGKGRGNIGSLTYIMEVHIFMSKFDMHRSKVA